MVEVTSFPFLIFRNGIFFCSTCRRSLNKVHVSLFLHRWDPRAVHWDEHLELLRGLFLDVQGRAGGNAEETLGGGERRKGR